MDLLQKLDQPGVEGDKLLRNIIETNYICEKDLHEVSVSYGKLMVFPNSTQSRRQMHAKGIRYQTDLRLFFINRVVDYLFQGKKPKMVIEGGSAGDISLALALPDSFVNAVDVDPNVFINELNCIPDEWFKKMGMKRRITPFYGEAEDKKFYERNKKIVNKILPRYVRDIRDGTHLRFPDGRFDFALVQGTPDMLKFFREEFSRILRPGGKLASIVYEEATPLGEKSFYKTGRHISWPEHKKTEPKETKLPLKEILVPKKFKNYETLCEFGPLNAFSMGTVFEFFEKLK